MQPTDRFWEGVGTGIGESPWWALLGALLIIGVLFVVAKYIYPDHKEIKMRELDIREREADSQQALAENLHGVMESNNYIAREFAAQNAAIGESKARSREMGGDLHRLRDDATHVRETTDRTAEQVDEIHRHIFREGTD
ncbi:hypothetical protein [Enorma phocaeensis]|uniref:hypothetical protein n=1 Tax=Enorma phocaeensis TaxID=1871019 RepID=UPI00235458AE|nr:hypothetical protein [Enorma phocaeensis]